MLKVAQIGKKGEWEDFILSIGINTFLQSWNWGEFHRSLGKPVVRLGVYRGSTMLAAAQIIQEDAKRGRHWLIPGGPVFSRWPPGPEGEELIRFLTERGRRKN